MLKDLSKYKNIFKLKTKNEIILESEKNKKNLYLIFGSLYMIWSFL